MSDNTLQPFEDPDANQRLTTRETLICTTVHGRRLARGIPEEYNWICHFLVLVVPFGLRVFFSLPDLAPDCIIINTPTLDYRKYVLSRATFVRFPLKVTALGGGRRSGARQRTVRHATVTVTPVGLNHASGILDRDYFSKNTHSSISGAWAHLFGKRSHTKL